MTKKTESKSMDERVPRFESDLLVKAKLSQRGEQPLHKTPPQRVIHQLQHLYCKTLGMSLYYP